jgi:hypothetical protein
LKKQKPKEELMFKFIHRSCHRCNGRLTDEWKLDLPGELELVCLNCGNRFWENAPKRKSFVDWEANECFREDQHRQILKHQGPKNKRRRQPAKRGSSTLNPVWLQV